MQSVSSQELRESIASVKVIPKGKAANGQNEISASETFETFAISPLLLQNIRTKGYTQPTPIQAQAIPHILAGKDVIGIANTGTGKTAAFLIPLIHKVLKNHDARILIITPTRELAVQIRDELQSFALDLDIRSNLLIGGMNIERQKENLKQNPNFIIGTPGRIKDLLRGKGFSLSQFHCVVLDEADRMVDIGFINDINYFISLLPRDRQSLFFSATVNAKVKSILDRFVSQPVTISVKKQEAAQNIHQEIVTVEPGYKKIDKLHDLLAQDEFTKVLVFGRTKWGIQNLMKELMLRGFKVAAIHGNKSQSQRQRALSDFKSGTVQILLATDVASRGLDITDVSHVINYDMPASMDDYIHRIGRTGRADKQGIALTFVS